MASHQPALFAAALISVSGDGLPMVGRSMESYLGPGDQGNASGPTSSASSASLVRLRDEACRLVRRTKRTAKPAAINGSTQPRPSTQWIAVLMVAGSASWPRPVLLAMTPAPAAPK